MHRSSFTLLSLSLASAISSMALAGDFLSIRTLAPEKSVLVLGADDIAASRERLEKTPLAGWWNAEETQKAMKKWHEDFEKSMGEWTQELGVPRESLTCPSSFGAAVFLQLNEDTGAEEPAFIAFLDWGADTEGFVKVYDAAIAKVEKEKPMPFTVEEMKGRRVYVFEQPRPVAEAGDTPGEDPEPQAPLANMKLCVTRDAGRFLVTGGTSAMDDILTRLDGTKEKSVADNDDFKGSMELVGGAPDVFAALLTEKALALMAAVEPQSMFMAGMVTPFLQPVFGDIRGWSLGMSLDTTKHPMSQAIGAYIPAGKVGLLSLLGTTKVEPVPAVVPGDAVSYGRLNVKWSDLTKVIEDVLAKLPEGMGDMARENIDPIMPKLKSAFAAMGNSVHMWTPADVVADAETGAMTSVTAIPVTDPKAAQGLLDLAGGAGMMKPRDFLGNTIFSTDDPVAPAFGFSAQYMLMGATDDVEVALRALGSKDGTSLSSDAAYQSAAATWSSDELVGWGFSNTIAMLESLQQVSEAAEDADPIGMGGLPEGMELDAFEEVLKPEFLKKYFGPTSWQVAAPKSGFRLDFFVLGPTESADKTKK